MDAEQAVRLVAEIELRLAFAQIGESEGGPEAWPMAGVAGPEEPSS